MCVLPLTYLLFFFRLHEHTDAQINSMFKATSTAFISTKACAPRLARYGRPDLGFTDLTHRPQDIQGILHQDGRHRGDHYSGRWCVNHFSISRPSPPSTQARRLPPAARCQCTTSAPSPTARSLTRRAPVASPLSLSSARGRSSRYGAAIITSCTQLTLAVAGLGRGRCPDVQGPTCQAHMHP